MQKLEQIILKQLFLKEESTKEEDKQTRTKEKNILKQIKILMKSPKVRQTWHLINTNKLKLIKDLTRIIRVRVKIQAKTMHKIDFT